MNEDKGIQFPSPASGERVVIRFKDTTEVRLVGGELTTTAETDVGNVVASCKKHAGLVLERMFGQTEEALEREVATLCADTGQELPSLHGYYVATTKTGKQAKALCSDLEKDPLIAEVYIEPPAVPALFDAPMQTQEDEAPPATPDFINLQGYLKPAPAGVDAYYAWTQAGGEGEQVEVIDIEGAWNYSHEDLLQVQGGVVGGIPTTNLAWENHGTAVQGVIGGDKNKFGIKGIAPKAKFSSVSIFGANNSVAKAIKTAADKLNAGDIILIELHRPGPNATGSGQFGFIAIEWWSADFAAVKYATAKGVIVIAAAGNGSQNLDDPVYQGKFDRNQRDSGAILVGAGAPPSGNYGADRSRLGFSNYGTLVDAQGWGREVTTTGYGDLQGGSDKNKWYTKSFSGTSSASPIVVGPVACLQSMKITKTGAPFNYQEIRDFLRKTGSPQQAGPNGPATQRIGNRPNIKQAALKLFGSVVVSGIATRYWIELLAYPSGSARLWLLVNGAWRKYDNPNASMSELVQNAFLGTGSNVRVWYQGNQIVGLVVEGN